MAWLIEVPNYYRDGRTMTITTGNPDLVARWTEKGATVTDAECATCDHIGSGFGPGHNGIETCRSGSLASGGTKPHCTCDSCF